MIIFVDVLPETVLFAIVNKRGSSTRQTSGTRGRSDGTRTYDAMQLVEYFHESEISTTSLRRELSGDIAAMNLLKMRRRDSKAAIC